MLTQVNLFATDLLLRAYLKFVKRTALSEIANATQRGYELEGQILQGLLSSGVLLQYQSMRKPDTQKQHQKEELTNITIDDPKYVAFYGKDFSQLQPLPKQRNGQVWYGTWIFRPLDPSFPRIDFVIVKHAQHGERKVIALQSTVSEPLDHGSKPESDWKGFFNPSPSSSPGVTWAELRRKLDIDEGDWHCDFLYVTTVEEPKRISETVYSQLPDHLNVAVMNRQLLSCLKIVY